MGYLHDDYSEEDLIGHGYSRDAVVKLVKSASVDAKSSFTVGLFGEWGTGKTTMLRQIETVLQGSDEVITVWFNPWQFSKDDDIVHAFFQLLAERLETVSEPTAHGRAEKVRGLATKVRQVGRALGFKSVDVQIPLLARLKFEEPGDRSEIQKCIEQLERNYGSIYYDMVRFLQLATADIDHKIVVFIDDLDRCMPDQSLRLLEGLKVLLDLPNFVFLVGVAHKIIERAVQKRFEDIFGDTPSDEESEKLNYLDKIFQFSFVLPRPDRSKVREKIIEPALPRFDSGAPYADVILEVIGTNLRSLKRFLNVVSFAESLSESRFLEDEQDFVRILKASLIAFVLPDLHRQFEKSAEALVSVNNAITAFDEASDLDLRDAIQTGNPSIDGRLTNQATVKLHQILKCGSAEHGFDDEHETRKYLSLSSSSLSFVSTGSQTASAGERTGRAASSTGTRFQCVGPGEFSFVAANDALVRFSNALYVAPYPVTQELYERVTGHNPSEFQGESLPVENVSWFDAVGFCNALSREYGLDEAYEVDSGSEPKAVLRPNASGFRLPTEAEWEFACAGDSYVGMEVDDFAWYMNNSGASTQPVGLKRANSHGLFDMLGNVWEWCDDWYAVNPRVDEGDPGGPEEGYEKVCRGGSWANFANVTQPTQRGRKNPQVTDNNIGFRIVTPTRLRFGI